MTQRSIEYITIDGFEQMSMQELFDAAATHVLKNGSPSMRPGSSTCQYSGIGCAAAPFIKPELRYMGDNRDGGSWRTLANHQLVPHHEKTLITRLQVAHDSAAAASLAERDGNEDPDLKEFVRDFKKTMLGIANDFDLNPALVAK